MILARLEQVIARLKKKGDVRFVSDHLKHDQQPRMPCRSCAASHAYS